jgi:hypothetical protein
VVGLGQFVNDSFFIFGGGWGGEQFSLTKIVKVDAASPELKLIPAERLQPIAQRRFQRSQQQRFHHDDQSINLNKHKETPLHSGTARKTNEKTKVKD